MVIDIEKAMLLITKQIQTFQELRDRIKHVRCFTRCVSSARDAMSPLLVHHRDERLLQAVSDVMNFSSKDQTL